MKRDFYKPLVWMMWLALPVTALKYWRVWDRLPMRMAVHFDASWQPNGYTSREGALMLGLGIMAVMLLLFTIAALIARAMKPEASWPILLLSYVVLAFLWFGNHSIVEWNLNPPPAHSQLVGPGSPAVRNSGATKFLLHS
ncbi:MAG TPA: DUF1648 domain-containing protein [Candidatus Sulfotelmatobacter sp.]|nr:DUF1648 domain-containing protein [Candidatus Sulfotelmatobacter sp.]